MRWGLGANNTSLLPQWHDLGDYHTHSQETSQGQEQLLKYKQWYLQFPIHTLCTPPAQVSNGKASTNFRLWNFKDVSMPCQPGTCMPALKILQARLQHYMNYELPDVQAGFWKGRGTKNQIANICWIMKKAREFQKNICFALLATPKPLTLWITTNCGQFLKRWEYQTTWSASWEIYMQDKKQQLDMLQLDMEQQTGSKSAKEYVKVYILTLLIWFICRVYHDKCWAGWSTSWNQDCWEKYK